MNVQRLVVMLEPRPPELVRLHAGHRAGCAQFLDRGAIAVLQFRLGLCRHAPAEGHEAPRERVVQPSDDVEPTVAIEGDAAVGR